MATEAALVTARAATPAARRTAVLPGWLPSPTSSSSGDDRAPLVGSLTTSPALPVTPRLDNNGRSLRPYALATSSPPSASSGPLAVWTTPTTTTSHRVLAGLALRRV